MMTTCPSTSTLGMHARCEPISTRHNRSAMAIEFTDRIRRIPVYPVAAGYDLGADMAMLASNESCFPPAPAVVDAAAAVIGGANRYPDPAYAPLRRALSERYGVAAERI